MSALLTNVPAEEKPSFALLGTHGFHEVCMRRSGCRELRHWPARCTFSLSRLATFEVSRKEGLWHDERGTEALDGRERLYRDHTRGGPKRGHCPGDCPSVAERRVSYSVAAAASARRSRSKEATKKDLG